MDEGDFSKFEFKISYVIVSVKMSFVTDVKQCQVEALLQHRNHARAQPATRKQSFRNETWTATNFVCGIVYPPNP